MDAHGLGPTTVTCADILPQVVPFDDDISDKLKIRGNTRKELASSLNFARFWMPRLFPCMLFITLPMETEAVGPIYRLVITCLVVNALARQGVSKQALHWNMLEGQELAN